MQADMADCIKELAALKVQRDAVSSQIAALEDSLKTACSNAQALGRWFTTGKERYRVVEQKGRRTLSRERLLEELATLMGEDGAAQCLALCETEGDPSLRLYVSTTS